MSEKRSKPNLIKIINFLAMPETLRFPLYGPLVLSREVPDRITPKNSFDPSLIENTLSINVYGPSDEVIRYKVDVDRLKPLVVQFLSAIESIALPR